MTRLLALCLCVLAVVADAPAQEKKITQRLSPAEQLPHFKVPAGFEVELVAADPLVINPITLALDEKGRIYVSESHTYRYGPSGSPVKPFSNPIIRLDPLPDGKGYQRTPVADGFEEPVMGMAIRDGKLWAAANNYLFQFDLADDGKTTNKKTILTDKNKAWNPFGMFVVEFGPDGLLYVSVGNHNIDISGPTNRVGGRGSSGIVFRMKPDGSDMQRLVHGLRVPYSFEYDPFGQLWLLSNGEGNPNRFVKVIDGLDYHCYSRGQVDNNWLAGKHVLAPPSFELPSGAHTQLVRYFAAGFPTSYQGSLLLDNWGAHGFNGANRAVFRYHPDDKGEIVNKESFLSCVDPHFRPSHIVVDPDGNLLVADWYGRDDESDMTGRVWKVKYTGTDKPVVTHKLDSTDWARDEYVLSALGSPHHLVREKATKTLVAQGQPVIGKVAAYAAGAKEPLGAASALWVLVQIGTPEAQAAIASGARNSDWHVRRLALNLNRRYKLPTAAALAKGLAKDAAPAVRLEAALTHTDPALVRTALLDVLRSPAASDAHLRYEAAWNLAKQADAAAFAQLLNSSEEAQRLAGLIALDLACYEDLPSKPAALATLARAITAPEGKDHDLLLTLAQYHGDKDVLTAVEKLLARPDVSPGVMARALLVLRARAGSLPPALVASLGKRFLDAVEKGAVKISGTSDQLLLLELLQGEGPTDFALKQVGAQLNGNPAVRPAAHALARTFGSKASKLAPALWPKSLNPKAKAEERIDSISTLARIDAPPNQANWTKLLGDANPAVRTDAVRWWRTFKDQPAMVQALVARSPELLRDDPGIKDDLAIVLRQLGVDATVLKKLELPEPTASKDDLTSQTLTGLAALAKLPAPERQQRTALGRQVFERSACVKCHTSVTQNTPLAPLLKGIATAQKADYLIESVLYPSKIMKTGFDTEVIVTKNGKIFTGLVRDEGDQLRVLNLDKSDVIAKKDIEDRQIQKVSIMPEGQEKELSRQEFLDLMTYLQSLK